mgnify:CR=1 FL=1
MSTKRSKMQFLMRSCTEISLILIQTNEIWVQTASKTGKRAAHAKLNCSLQILLGFGEHSIQYSCALHQKSHGYATSILVACQAAFSAILEHI